MDLCSHRANLIGKPYIQYFLGAHIWQFICEGFVTWYASHFVFSYLALKQELTSWSGAQYASLSVHKSESGSITKSA